ncbi:MAG: GspE/PulE family protein [Candidatus Pacebacteria bacterium]|nr:GspE/PulE family protein [Candidatus Paceibacterota bacterium]
MEINSKETNAAGFPVAPTYVIIPDEQLESLVKTNGLIPEESLLNAKNFAEREKITLYESILRMDLLSDQNMGIMVADHFNLPFVQLSNIVISKDILNIIPEVVARRRQVISFDRDKDGLHVAMADPNDVETVEFLKKKTDLPVVVCLATAQDIENAISLYSEDIAKVFEGIIKENLEKSRGTSGAEGTNFPIIKILDTIISYAYQNKASDIHIEPQNEGSVTRFRIDGVLHDIAVLPIDIHPQIVSRVKILSDLRIDEHQSAQDGKFKFETPSENLDVRVSIVPVTKGENIVLRLLSERSRQFSLESLGFSAEDLEKTKAAYAKPYGMVLSTGPTGSGKTTTMYAVLKILNKRGINISTIEDPVEYEMEGVSQIQVNPKTNLTFAAGLRSILRQDPNIMLVGEIRDEETASIATSAALTGHLVLSTMHANNPAVAILRLLEMGAEPFLLASTINVIIAQRLVRRIHFPCRASKEISRTEIAALAGEELTTSVFGSGETVSVYKGAGCKLDYGTGYEGRIGIFEVMIMNDEIREAIMSKQDAGVIYKIALKSGMKSMMQDGLEKVAQGLTTLEEVILATKE